VIDFFEAGGVEPVVLGDVGHIDDHDENASTSMDAMMGSDDDEHDGFMVLVPAQDTVTISFTVTEGMLGEWGMGCFLMNGMHYTAGMVGSLTVIK